MISKELDKRIFTSLFLLILVFGMYKINIILLCVLIIFGALSIFEFNKVLKILFLKRNRSKKKKILHFLVYLFSFIFYIFFTFISVYLLATSDFILKIFLFYFLIICLLSDIGGFVFGNIFRGPKLTKISPKKTISGAIGSVLLVTIFSFSEIFFKLFTIEIKNIFFLTTISIMTSILCQIGDLFFSFLKRKANIKDFGNILPGHGGVLDRLDGILLGLPSAFLITILFDLLNLL